MDSIVSVGAVYSDMDHAVLRTALYIESLVAVQGMDVR